MDPPAELPRPKRRLFLRLLASIAASAVLFLAVLGLTDLVLAWRDSGSEPGLAEESHCEYDPELGWVNKKSTRIPDLYGPGRTLTTNAQGFRAREDHAQAIPDGRYRIVCLGDSFTLGYGVDDTACYPAQLEALEPAIQAVNMGQGGYGVDQCYLWYRRDGAALDADLLLLAFIAPDFERMCTARFQGEYPKPLLTVDGGALQLPDRPLPRDWENARGSRRFRRFLGALALGDFVERWNRRSGSDTAPADPFPCRDVAELVLADLARMARERGQGLALVHLPLRGTSTPSDPLAQQTVELITWLAPRADSLGVPLIDLAADFAALPPGQRDACWLEDGHLNPFGNRWVAERLLAHLRERFPDLP